MNVESPRVYLANMYTNLFSPRGLGIMEKNGLRIGGNLFDEDCKHDLTDFRPDLIVYSPTPEDITSGFWDEIKNGKYPFVLFSNFLDRDIGWNEKEGYRYKSHKHFAEPLNSRGRIGQVLAASKHGAETIRETYGLSPDDVGFCYMGIDYHGISQKQQTTPPDKSPTKVLWDHMWRADKGFRQALNIIRDLSKRHPNITFVINQKNSWRGSEEAITSLKSHLSKFLDDTNGQNNIILNDRFSSRELYYSFLATHQISFCTARIENFGYGMLEQSAAGIATAVPTVACYPEMYVEYTYDLDNLGIFVESLILDPVLRQKVGLQRQRIAKSFDVENRIPPFVEQIKKSVE